MQGCLWGLFGREIGKQSQGRGTGVGELVGGVIWSSEARMDDETESKPIFLS